MGNERIPGTELPPVSGDETPPVRRGNVNRRNMLLGGTTLAGASALAAARRRRPEAAECSDHLGRRHRHLEHQPQ